MGSKIAASLAAKGRHFERAGDELHHLKLGPGPELEAEWTSAGLELPDLDVMSHYRFGRVQQQLQLQGYDGMILMDPMNIRYVTDTTNMQVWVMHNASRYAWVGADGSVILWEFYDCEFLSGHSPIIDEVRPAIACTYFMAGKRYEEKTRQWADEMISVIVEKCGQNAKIAIDQCQYLGYKHLADAGISIGSGQEVMELARTIKGPDEIRAMRCAIHACETSMTEMYEQVTPGMTERELWAMLHAGNIKRAGEWVETQLLASGPRTNPWMQEASSRVIEHGDLVGYDTDLVGAYGMMVDISRTWLAGAGTPTAVQQRTHDLASEQILRNGQLLTPGTGFRELTEKAWFPSTDDYHHYCALYHGVGQCDEYPEIVFPEHWDDLGSDGELQPGMVLSCEAFVGARDGRGEGVKLEEQYLVTEHGSEKLSSFPLGLTY